jgi:enoyl-CoA hydratase/3-hydroxyacyl-CoA dehydrogenase
MTVNTKLLTGEGTASTTAVFLEQAARKAEAAQLHAPHQLACINAIKAGIQINGLVGLETEKQEFLRVASSNSAKALVHFFFAQRATGKMPSGQAPKPRKMNKIAVIGGGTMGSGIVVSCLEAGYTVLLKEINDKLL